MTPKRQERINQVLSKRQNDLTVITDQVVKNRNLAAIMRTCDAVGIPKMHCVEAEERYRTYAGISASSHKWVETIHYDNVVTSINTLKSSGMQIIAANLTDDAIDYREVDYTKPTALLMGTELIGVSDAAAKACDQNIVIPMMGMVESFNVSVACAIILAEAQRQREAAGLYDQCQLSKEEYDRLFFKWAYPDLAKYCEDRGIEYLPLDKNGDLIPGTAPNKV